MSFVAGKVYPSLPKNACEPRPASKAWAALTGALPQYLPKGDTSLHHSAAAPNEHHAGCLPRAAGEACTRTWYQRCLMNQTLHRLPPRVEAGKAELLSLPHCRAHRERKT
ncbi:hypothetical protein E2C01_076375 [Portunus trituberculatus]|uniref:Uncharacterized protein n=1 Tax=Portunus trituberculatus TaxID=210409 RepID=A0A5B7IHI3_PORTR|nr:hypothetical protein [Portunus trituberculatus]